LEHHEELIGFYAKFISEWAIHKESFEQALSKKSNYSKKILIFEAEHNISTISYFGRIANRMSHLYFILSELLQNTSLDHTDFTSLDKVVKCLQNEESKKESEKEKEKETKSEIINRKLSRLLTTSRKKR